MSEPKFTKGPWEAGKNPAFATVLNGSEGKAIYPEDGTHHIAWANVFDDDGNLKMDEALANAALIAAAPEMYRMLEDLLDRFRNDEFAPEIEKLLKKARERL